ALMISVSTILPEVRRLTSLGRRPNQSCRLAIRQRPLRKQKGPTQRLVRFIQKRLRRRQSLILGQKTQAPSAESFQSISAPKLGPEHTPSEQPRQIATETTGMAAHDEEVRRSAPIATNESKRRPHEITVATPTNRYNIQACSGANKSFQAS